MGILYITIYLIYFHIFIIKVKAHGDHFLEIPKVKTVLMENRRKEWDYYYHRLLVQCITIYKFNHVGKANEILIKLHECFVVQRKEIYDTANRTSQWFVLIYFCS